jgi:outer membrane protein
MKNNMLVLLICLASTFSLAQAPQPVQKIGHADWDFIFSQMPEYKVIESELKTFETQLQNQLKTKAQEIETKYNAYTALAPDTPAPIKRDKESELAYLQENLQKFQQDAQASLQKKQADLMKPVFEKVGKAIETVAVENGFAYIINPQMMNGGDVLLFADEKYNISNLVLKKLGIDISKSEKAATK